MYISIYHVYLYTFISIYKYVCIYYNFTILQNFTFMNVRMYRSNTSESVHQAITRRDHLENKPNVQPKSTLNFNNCKKKTKKVIKIQKSVMRPTQYRYVRTRLRFFVIFQILKCNYSRSTCFQRSNIKSKCSLVNCNHNRIGNLAVRSAETTPQHARSHAFIEERTDAPTHRRTSH